MSKKKFPSTKFRVPCYHPKTGERDWVVWRADAATARVAAHWNFTAKHGFAPTHIDEPTIFRRRPSPLFGALFGMAAAMSVRDAMHHFGESDPYRAHHLAHGGHF